MKTKEENNICGNSSELVDLEAKSTLQKDNPSVYDHHAEYVEHAIFVLHLIPWLNVLLVCQSYPRPDLLSLNTLCLEVLVFDMWDLSLLGNSYFDC